MEIAKGLTDWLTTLPACTDLDGAVFWSRVDPNATMPWLVIKPLPGGDQRPISKLRMEFDVSIDLTLDTADQVSGWEFMGELSRVLNNFRGDLLPAEDVFFRCKPIYEVDGPVTNFRIILPLRIRYLADSTSG